MLDPHVQGSWAKHVVNTHRQSPGRTRLSEAHEERRGNSAGGKGAMQTLHFH